MKSYILCSTPRTGSTLLCSLLKATNRAGFPESYFRAQDLEARVDDWQIRQPDGSFAFRTFVKCVLERGSTPNGIFAVRIMWGTMDGLVRNLRASGMRGRDRDVLAGVFGQTKFVYLQRRDAVAQAISRLRAEQTNIWHIAGAEGQKVAESGGSYDRAAIAYFVDEAVEHGDAWNRWFRQNDILPLRLFYEDLDHDKERETRKVLEFIDVAPASFPVEAPNIRMADATSQEWAERFRAETDYTSCGQAADRGSVS